MPCILSLPTKDCYRRLYEAGERANQAASEQRKEVADSDLTVAYAGTSWHNRETTLLGRAELGELAAKY